MVEDCYGEEVTASEVVDCDWSPLESTGADSAIQRVHIVYIASKSSYVCILT